MRSVNRNIKDEDINWYVGQLVELAEVHHDILRSHQKVLNNHSEGLELAIKMAKKNRRSVRINTMLSVAAISYVVISARTMLYFDRRVNNLISEFMSLMKKRDERDRTEGK